MINTTSIWPLENQILFIGMGNYLSVIPNSPGVYFFYAESGALLYIGKSKHLRKRIQSHISSANTDTKEARLLSQTKKITWKETAGELGALLLEAKLIKTMMPIFNRLLRRNKSLFSLHASIINEYIHLKVVPVDLNLYDINDLHGLFKNKRAALEHLQLLIKEAQLCPKLCFIDHSKKQCFQYQIKRCYGACISQEAPENYNARLDKTISNLSMRHWPFKGRIAIREKTACLEEWHVIDHWIYSETISELSQLPYTPLDLKNFDIDYYRILLQWFNTNKSTLDLIELDNIGSAFA